MQPAKPVVAPDRAERWARRTFGITAKAYELPGYVDRNFRLDTNAGGRYVMKIAPTGQDVEALEAVIAALHHLERTSVGRIVPRVVATASGKSVARLVDETGRPVLARLFTYLRGQPLALAGAPGTGLAREIGSALGLLDAGLAGFDHPGVHRTHSWDLAQLLELRPLVDLLHSDHRPLVEKGLSMFEAEVFTRLPELRRSVIHNDANDYNLLVDGSESRHQQLAGIIDFGDLLFTVTVAELAIASAYVMLHAADPGETAETMRTAYENEWPLTDAERALLPTLIVGRLCTSLLLSTRDSRQQPDNAYLTISQKPVADLLRMLL